VGLEEDHADGPFSGPSSGIVGVRQIFPGFRRYRMRLEPSSPGAETPSSLCITNARLPLLGGSTAHHMRAGTPSVPPSKQSERMIMKTLMSALVAMTLVGIAAPASAAALDGCPPGYDQAYDTCVRVLP
jgi:hypothetical protein